MYAKLLNNLETLKLEKMHSCISGVEAASKRKLTYFISCHDLIQNLKKAFHENRLESRLRHYGKYKVLIIDEIGYLPIDNKTLGTYFHYYHE